VADEQVRLPPGVEKEVQRILDEVAQRMWEERRASPWLTAQEAADYLRCPLSRVRKLTMTGGLPHGKDGRRVLYNRWDLDRFVRKGGAVSP
jgi:excisionase family DNA binding protein